MCVYVAVKEAAFAAAAFLGQVLLFRQQEFGALASYAVYYLGVYLLVRVALLAVSLAYDRLQSVKGVFGTSPRRRTRVPPSRATVLCCAVHLSRPHVGP